MEEPRTDPAAEPTPATAEFQGPPATPFGLMRIGLAFVVSAALAALVAMHFLEVQGLLPLAFEAGVVLYIGVTGDAMLRWAQARIRREREETQRLWLARQKELQEIASRDDLTRLQNRRFFYERLEQELGRMERLRKPLSVVMIDVDDLKGINDEFGHQVGDIVLRQFGRMLNRHATEAQVTARLGGDEFAVILPEADHRAAEQFAWRLWDELARAPVYESEHASIYLGVSIGTGGYPWGGTSPEEIIHWADAKLYANKLERKGFNRDSLPKDDGRLASAVVEVLSAALDIRDRLTHRHSRRVARMASAVAEQMGLSQDDILEIEHAAALHDIGKIGVADSILRKAAALEVDEWREMRRHSELGYEILKGIDFLRRAAEIVYSHHERFDGTGYPRGLVAQEIPLGARVFAVVDAFDAITSRRPYRDATPREAATIEIARHAGSQFDPQVVEAFLTVLRRGPDGLCEDDELGDDFEMAAAVPEESDAARV